MVYDIKAKGKEILLLGSLKLDEATQYPENVDLLILPSQGSCELEKEAAKLIDRIKPKKIFLPHFDNSIPPLSRSVDTRPLKRMMDEKYPQIQVVKSRAGKAVHF